MNQIRNIVQKEFFGFFSSLTAFIFFGGFLSVTLFVFFWVDAFFARNIADVRPMFEWMPVLLIFLIPSLTMRMWSEERRSGTLEMLLTVPVSNVQLVCGKFLACMGLVAVALFFTLPLPLSVSFIAGQIDWGPVFGGYIAALFLAAAYTAIGLTISSRTDNQIVSLLLSVLLCSIFMLVGCDAFTNLFDGNTADILKLFGSGARFQSILRGIIDFRDLYYYASVTGVFLSLNALGLESLRWAGNKPNNKHKQWQIISSLCIANLIAGNLWLQQIAWARVDLTQGQIYTISAASKKYMSELQEPLLIRGYFSKKSHALLQPLIPKLRDLLKEYALASNGKVKVEFVDPIESPEIEKEAVEKYGIKPVVFQTANKYQAALTNSYFDVLLKYGDQFQKLNWKDMIEVKARGDNDITVDLKNPEYDITTAVKKLLQSYQSSGNIFVTIDKPVSFTAYISADEKLPPQLRELKGTLKNTLETLQAESKGKLSVSFLDPEADGGKLAQQLQSQFGFKPMAVSIVNPQLFWFCMTVKCGDQTEQVSLPETMAKGSLERSIMASLKKFSRGFLKTIGIFNPKTMDMALPENLEIYRYLRDGLAESYNVKDLNLDKGIVPSEVDLLLVLAPNRVGETEAFAIDQFLMKGGTVILASSPYAVKIDKTISAQPAESGLEPWLKNYGIELEKTMVLDRHNFPFPTPSQRPLGPFTVVEETQLAPYPYFIDIRNDVLGTNKITSGLNQILMSWASPIKVDRDKNKDHKITELLRSSAQSWTSNRIRLQPHYDDVEPLGFPVGSIQNPQILGVSIEGSFASYFKDSKLPWLEQDAQRANKKQITGVNLLTKSPESARLVIFSSNSFLSDKVITKASQAIQSLYTKPVELIENVADWSLQDRDLLALRGRGNFARVLKPMSQDFEMAFEYLNYGLAASGLLVLWFCRQNLSKRNQKRYSKVLESLIKKEKAEEARA